MKKRIFLSFALLCIILTCYSTAYSQGNGNNGNGPNSDQALINRAKGAWRGQCSTQLTSQIGGNVSVVSACFVDGFIRRVHLYPIIQCHKEPCPLILVRLLGTVDFDCDGNIIGVTCL